MPGVGLAHEASFDQAVEAREEPEVPDFGAIVGSFALIMIGCLLVELLPAERGLAFVGVLDRAWSTGGTRSSEANEIAGASVAGVGASSTTCHRAEMLW